MSCIPLFTCTNTAHPSRSISKNISSWNPPASFSQMSFIPSPLQLSRLVAVMKSLALYYSQVCMSSLLRPLRTGSTSDEYLSCGASQEAWHMKVPHTVDWMIMVFYTQWFYKLFLSPGICCNSFICFSHLWPLNSHFFLQIIFREVFPHWNLSDSLQEYPGTVICLISIRPGSAF